MEVTLRKYQLSDVDHFMGWATDPEVLRFSRLKTWVHDNSSKEDIVSYFSQVVIPHPWYQAICLKGNPVGFICIDPVELGDHNKGRGTIAFAIGRKYWGRGIVTLATTIAVSEAFKEIPQLKRIEATTNPKNKASQRLLEKAGFLKEGLLKNYLIINGQGIDQIVYSLGPTDVSLIGLGI